MDADPVHLDVFSVEQKTPVHIKLNLSYSEGRRLLIELLSTRSQGTADACRDLGSKRTISVGEQQRSNVVRRLLSPPC